MFAKTIIDSDAFLDMPLSSQALYFHLSMRADDDGFINNSKKIQRMLGCADDDLRILLTKNFIIPFETGVCVIKHWKIHNLIQKDRYKATIYGEHKEKLSLKNNNVYTMDTQCIQDGSSLEAQYSIDKISKERSSHEGFDLFWSEYPNKSAKVQAQKAWNKHKPDLDIVMSALSWQKESKQWKSGYVPLPATYINGARWEDENPNSSYGDIFAGAI
jgi:hypothetical protein